MSAAGTTGITPVAQVVTVDGVSTTPQPNEVTVEQSLDIEMANAIAPAAQVYAFEGATVDSTLSAMATKQPLINQLSASWHFCGDPVTQQIAYEFAAQGQSFFEACGDTGVFAQDPTLACAPNVSSVDLDAVTLVGGTLLGLGGTPEARIREVAASWSSGGILRESTNYTNNFNDINDGTSNGTATATGFSAVTGYDLVTGWGSPKCNLMTTLTTPCANSQTDPKNCGACWHDCGLGTCVAGVCQPYTIGPNFAAAGTYPSSLSFDGTNVVYGELTVPMGDTGNVGTSVSQVNVRSGTVTALSTDPNAVAFLDGVGVGNGTVLWGDGNYINKTD